MSVDIEIIIDKLSNEEQKIFGVIIISKSGDLLTKNENHFYRSINI